MSYQRAIPEAEFHKQRRSLLRKKTRAGWGVGISGALTAGGLYYMAGAAGVAAYGYKKTDYSLEDFERMMAERGIKPRSRDRLASFLVGTGEKFALSAILLGHSEALCLDGIFDTDLAALNDEVMEHSASGWANEIANTPVDYAQILVHYEPGSIDPSENMVVGSTAALVEFGSGKLGDAGSNMRNKYETGESRAATLQRMGVPKR